MYFYVLNIEYWILYILNIDYWLLNIEYILIEYWIYLRFLLCIDIKILIMYRHQDSYYVSASRFLLGIGIRIFRCFLSLFLSISILFFTYFFMFISIYENIRFFPKVLQMNPKTAYRIWKWHAESSCANAASVHRPPVIFSWISEIKN